MRRSLLTTLASVVLIAATSVPAFADSCANVSRPAPAGYTSATVYTAPLLEGGWVWLPSLTSIGIPAQFLPPFWGKATPGTFDSTLLGASAVCSQSSQAYVIRQTAHGIQSGCV